LKIFNFLVGILILAVSTGYAQESFQATLLGWEQRTQNFMLDRAHNFGGTHFNRGLFRDHINKMSPEHEIDLLTYRYTLFEDYDWLTSNQAYRLSMGSLNATNFAIENSVKSDITLHSNGLLSIEGYQEENLRTQRMLFYLGYDHKLGLNHHVGVNHTLSGKKSDLDATFFYRYGSLREGMIQINITLQDWAGNVTQGLAEDGRNEYNDRYEIVHHYNNFPELMSLQIVTPRWGRWRAELVGGFQIYSQKKVNYESPDYRFQDEEWAHYLGGLLEYSGKDYGAGITYQRRFSKLRRIPNRDSNYDLDFTNRQITNQLGLYGARRIRKLRLEQWVWYNYNIDYLSGDKIPGDLSPLGFERIPFHYVEKQFRVKSSVLYDPILKGLKAGVQFHAEYTYPQGETAENGVRNYDFRRAYPIIKDRNERLTFTIGYRVNRNFYFLGGISYDLDGDKQSGIGLPKITGTPTWFDGGFGRFSISW
jgi:hypothetical protein